MRLDLYQLETARIATEQTALLDEVQQRLNAAQSLSRLEQNGVLHALQVLVENAIGKAKQLLKAAGEVVPLSAHDAFASLASLGKINAKDVQQWSLIIGLRNKIVHDYINIDMTLVYQLIMQKRYLFVTAFLCRPFEKSNASSQ